MEDHSLSSMSLRIQASTIDGSEKKAIDCRNVQATEEKLLSSSSSCLQSICDSSAFLSPMNDENRQPGYSNTDDVCCATTVYLPDEEEDETLEETVGTNYTDGNEIQEKFRFDPDESDAKIRQLRRDKRLLARQELMRTRDTIIAAAEDWKIRRQQHESEKAKKILFSSVVEMVHENSESGSCSKNSEASESLHHKKKLENDNSDPNADDECTNSDWSSRLSSPCASERSSIIAISSSQLYQ